MIEQFTIQQGIALTGEFIKVDETVDQAMIREMDTKIYVSTDISFIQYIEHSRL